MSKRAEVYFIRFMNTIRVIPVIIRVLTLCGISFSAAYSQFGIGSHTVTVQVAPISVLQVSAGTVNLNIAAANAVAGQDEMSVSDQTTSLLWGTNSSNQKITAATSLGAQQFVLKLIAAGPTNGIAAPEFIISGTPADLLLGIGRSSGTCSLRYTGIALASQGTGTDIHTITFTLQAQ